MSKETSVRTLHLGLLDFLSFNLETAAISDHKIFKKCLTDF